MKKINNLKGIHIGTIIKQIFSESSMTMQEFASKIRCDRTTVYDIFKRKSIDIERLILISQVLNFDFVNEIYYEEGISSEKSPKKFIALEIDNESFKILYLPDHIVNLINEL